MGIEDERPKKVKAQNQNDIKPANLTKAWHRIVSGPLVAGPIYGFNKDGINIAEFKDGVICRGASYSRNYG